MIIRLLEMTKRGRSNEPVWNKGRRDSKMMVDFTLMHVASQTVYRYVSFRQVRNRGAQPDAYTAEGCRVEGQHRCEEMAWCQLRCSPKHQRRWVTLPGVPKWGSGPAGLRSSSTQEC